MFDDPVVVRGKGFEVKRSHIEDAFTAYAANLAARGETLPELQRPLREAQLLDRLIITRLLVNRAPVAQCADVIVSAGTNCTAEASVDNHSYDPDGDTITITQTPSGPYPLGIFPAPT